MEAPALSVHAVSDAGRKRSKNEDHHAAWIPEEPGERERRGVLLVVADGMGGTQAGEVASRIAVEAVVRSYAASMDGGDPLPSLKGAVEEANRRVHVASLASDDLKGMGTTCTAMVVRDREIWVAHVGDSRAYLLRGGAMHPLTEDHSLVATLVRRREITAEQARSDSRRNLVTRCVGLRETVEVDAGRIESVLEPGDTLLLCSDGLHGQVSDPEMAALVQGRPLDKACRDLVELANRRGGPDNITVVAARLDSPAAASSDEAASRSRTRLESPKDHASVVRRETGRRAEFSPIQFLLVLFALAVALLALLWWTGRGAR
jgi:protein phosphatase